MGLGTPVIQRRADGADGRKPLGTAFWQKIAAQKEQILVRIAESDF